MCGYIFVVVNRNISTNADGECPRPGVQAERKVRIGPRGGRIGGRDASCMCPGGAGYRKQLVKSGSVGMGEIPDVAGP